VYTHDEGGWPKKHVTAIKKLYLYTCVYQSTLHFKTCFTATDGSSTSYWPSYATTMIGSLLDPINLFSHPQPTIKIRPNFISPGRSNFFFNIPFHFPENVELLSAADAETLKHSLKHSLWNTLSSAEHSINRRDGFPMSTLQCPV
jgi:hypothetical protein